MLKPMASKLDSSSLGDKKSRTSSRAETDGRKRNADPGLTEGVHYRQIVEQLPAITYVADLGLNGQWRYVSPQILTFLGYSQSEWLAAKGLWFRLVHPDDRARVMEAEAHSHTKREVMDIEYRMLARDGRLLWFRDSAMIVRETDGSERLHGFMLDVTDRREAETALLRLSRQTNMILDSAGDGIFGLDPQGSPTFVNRAAARMLGYEPEEIVGRGGHALWHLSLIHI